MLESLLNKVAGRQDLLKRDSATQVFSCEICEIFKNTLMVASDRLRNVFAQQIFTIQHSVANKRFSVGRSMS